MGPAACIRGLSFPGRPALWGLVSGLSVEIIEGQGTPLILFLGICCSWSQRASLRDSEEVLLVQTGLYQGPSSGDCHCGPGPPSRPLQKTACSSRQAGLRLWPWVSARLASLHCRQAQLLTGVSLALGHVEQESPSSRASMV